MSAFDKKTAEAAMDKADRMQMSFFDEVYERMVPEDNFLCLPGQAVSWRKFRKTLRKLHR